MSRAFHVIEAPTSLGLRPPSAGLIPGTRLAPHALRRAGLHEKLSPAQIVSLNEPPYSPDLDPTTGVRNLRALVTFTRELADAIGAALDARAFPLVLGGDCSVLLGAGLALRKRGRHGLVFLDGHCDFANPANCATYASVAGMDLALATGRGVDALADLDGLRPYFRDEDTLLVGDKEDGAAPGYFAPDLFQSGLQLFRFPRIRERGLDAAIAEIVRLIAAAPVAGFWLHLDIDILAPELMPAVDSPDPGGFDWTELARVLDSLIALPQVIGMELTIFDPTLDPDGHLTRQLATFMADRLKALR